MSDRNPAAVDAVEKITNHAQAGQESGLSSIIKELLPTNSEDARKNLEIIKAMTDSAVGIVGGVGGAAADAALKAILKELPKDLGKQVMEALKHAASGASGSDSSHGTNPNSIKEGISSLIPNVIRDGSSSSGSNPIRDGGVGTIPNIIRDNGNSSGNPGRDGSGISIGQDGKLIDRIKDSGKENGSINEFGENFRKFFKDQVVSSDQSGVINLSTGDKFIRVPGAEVLVGANGDSLVVNKDGSYNVNAKDGVGVKHDDKSDTTTLTYANGDTVSIKGGHISDVQRDNGAVHFNSQLEDALQNSNHWDWKKFPPQDILDQIKHGSGSDNAQPHHHEELNPGALNNVIERLHGSDSKPRPSQLHEKTHSELEGIISTLKGR